MEPIDPPIRCRMETARPRQCMGHPSLLIGQLQWHGLWAVLSLLRASDERRGRHVECRWAAMGCRYETQPFMKKQAGNRFNHWVEVKSYILCIMQPKILMVSEATALPKGHEQAFSQGSTDDVFPHRPGSNQTLPGVQPNRGKSSEHPMNPVKSIHDIQKIHPCSWQCQHGHKLIPSKFC